MHLRHGLRKIAGIALLLALAGAEWAQAQPGAIPKAADDDKFSFGPPLRRNVVMGYKYTERVSVVNELNGHPFDSTERTLSYFITERQVPADKKGLLNIEANIDSMHIEYRAPDSKVIFNTQHFDGAGPQQNILKHREVFVPTVLVNHLVTFTLSPYGEVMKVECKGLDNAKEQAKDPALNNFLRERLNASSTDEFLESILLPWRSVAPLWKNVAYGSSFTMKNSAVLDRTSFKASPNVQFVKSDNGAPTLRFSAQFDKPLNKTMTLAAMDDPIKVVSGEGKINGELTLDQDGVVHSGWSVATGSITGIAGGPEVKSRVRHEIYFEPIGDFTFSSN